MIATMIPVMMMTIIIIIMAIMAKARVIIQALWWNIILR